MCTGLGGGGGLSPEQQAQLQAMLKATKAPPSTIPATLTMLGQPAAPGASFLSGNQATAFKNLSAMKKKGIELNPMQTERLTRLTKLAASKRLDAVPASQLLMRSAASSLANDARMSVLERRGYKATVATSSMGDAGFGTSLSRPV